MERKETSTFLPSKTLFSTNESSLDIRENRIEYIFDSHLPINKILVYIDLALSFILDCAFFFFLSFVLVWLIALWNLGSSVKIHNDECLVGSITWFLAFTCSILYSTFLLRYWIYISVIKHVYTINCHDGSAFSRKCQAQKIKLQRQFLWFSEYFRLMFYYLYETLRVSW